MKYTGGSSTNHLIIKLRKRKRQAKKATTLISNFYRFSFPSVSDTVTVEEPDPVEIADEPVKDPEPSLDLLAHTEVSDGFLVSKENCGAASVTEC